MKYTIELWGPVPSKKNNLRPVQRKNGKMGLVQDRGVQKQLDDLMVQIPGSVRNLNLVHPDVDIYFTVPAQRMDRDNMAVGISDLLVTARCIKDDNIAQFNGKLTIHPAVISDHWKTVIVLTAMRGASPQTGTNTGELQLLLQ